jgi:hypothetical protein
MRRLRLGRAIAGSAALLLLGAWATTAGPRASATAPPAPASSQALHSPIRGLSPMRREIPPVLLQAMKDPYAPPALRECTGLGAEVQALDAALGPDADSEPPSGDRNDLGWRLLAGGARSLIPYYGWVRRLSGAERRDREAFAAREAGLVRRAYLKGIGEAIACPAPAAPARSTRRTTREAPWTRPVRIGRA